MITALNKIVDRLDIWEFIFHTSLNLKFHKSVTNNHRYSILDPLENLP
jgi:hypothetical protein